MCPVRHSSAAVPRLLERRAEIATLARCCASAAKGSGQLVVIEGPAGVGKSRLLEEATAIGRRRGMRGLLARGSELEQDFPFALVRQLFHPLLRRAARQHGAFSGPAWPARTALGLEADPSASQGALLHGLYWLTANLSEELPLVIGCDDAQWGDEASLRWIGYLARRIEGMPVLVVVSVRAGEHGVAASLVDAIRTERSATRVSPLPLGPDATSRLVLDALGDNAPVAFRRACHAATGGNPLLLRQLLAAFVEERVTPGDLSSEDVFEFGPAALDTEIGRRLSRLGGNATSLAQAVAVLGPGAELRHAAELADLGLDAASTTAESLADADIITGSPVLDFVHPLVRTAVYGRMPEMGRARLHAEAARLFIAEGLDPAVVARHLLRTKPAGDPATVVRLQSAAADEFGHGAPAAAALLLRRALAEPPPEPARPTLLRELGNAEARGGDPRAAEHLAQALELLDDPSERAHVALDLASALADTGSFDRAVPVLVGALEEVGEADSELALLIEAELVSIARFDLRTVDLAQHRLAAMRVTSTPSTPSGWRLLVQAALEAWVSARPARQGRRLLDLALADRSLVAREHPETLVLASLASGLIFSERLDQALELLDDLHARSLTRGSPAGFVRSLALRSETQFRLGNLLDAEADARAALDVAIAEQLGVDLPFAAGALVSVLVARDRLDEAQETVDRYRLHELPVAWVTGTVLAHRLALLNLGQGRAREAAQELLACGERATAWGIVNPGVIPWRSDAALALSLDGDVERAAPLAAEEVKLARVVGTPRALGIALRAQGLIAGGTDREELLTESVDVLEKSPARLEHARSLMELGATMRGAGRRAEARAALSLALDRAHRCGAPGLAARARQELLSAGARPRRTTLTGADSLTPSERRIAVMAASGMKNREIAQRLFLTVKTVEMHLSRIFAKLGLRSRRELPEALAGDAPGEASPAHSNWERTSMTARARRPGRS